MSRSRLALLIHALDRFPRATVAELAARLGATPTTVRRDLADLREAGLASAGYDLKRTDLVRRVLAIVARDPEALRALLERE